MSKVDQDYFVRLLDKLYADSCLRLGERVLLLESWTPDVPPAPWHRRWRRKVAYRVERARIRLASWVYPGDLPESEW